MDRTQIFSLATRLDKNGLFLTILIITLIVFPLPFAIAQSQILPSDQFAGKEVFDKKGCIKCHMVWGSGGSEGPNLSDKKFYGTFLGLAAIMWNHAPEMLKKAQKLNIAYSQMEEKDVAEIIAFLCSLRFSGEKGIPFIGNKLLQSKRCLECHSIGENEKKVGPDFSKIDFYVSPLFMTQAMWNHGPNIWGNERTRGIKHIVLTADEIINITAALQEMTRPARIKDEYMSFGNIMNGEHLLSEKGCVTCHAVGIESTFAPNLEKFKGFENVLAIAAAMWNHGPAMWEKMQELNLKQTFFRGSEMSDLVSYLFYKQYMKTSGSSIQGEKIFAKKSCTSCHHGDSSLEPANGLVKLPHFVTPLQMVQAMWNHVLIMHEKMKNLKLNWPEFTEQEMMDLYAFLGKAK